MKHSNALAEAIMTAYKTKLDGGSIYYFAGSVPADADDPLDMATDHTEVLHITVGGGGTGITFDAADGDSISKAAAEAWSGLIAFDGTVAGPGDLTPTFFRYCEAGDDGRAAATTEARLQGTIGGPSSGADIKLSTGTTLTDNGVNTRGLPIFTLTLPDVV